MAPSGRGEDLVKLLIPDTPGTWPGKYQCEDRSLIKVRGAGLARRARVLVPRHGGWH